MPIPSDLNDEVTFISGINADGTAGQKTYWGWKGDSPATFGPTPAQKWGAATAGTTSGTIYYYFDPASNWNTTEQTSFVAGLSLWSAVANITFVATTVASQAQLTITRGSNGGGWDSSSTSTTANPSINQITASLVSIDTSRADLFIDGLLTTHGGTAAETILHELGHALGLGHAGPYNGGFVLAQKNGVYDATGWSVMSYIPTDLSGQTWGFSKADYQGYCYPVVPTTWMPADILAIQRLYGTPTSTPLSGGQVFGFNCNITGAIAPFFDFTKNSTPVVTIWDAGGNNTLDLSGFSANATVNLNAGTLTSCAGMTRNIAIADGTVVDTAVGGAGDDMFIANEGADVLSGGAGNDTFDMEGTLTAADRIDGGTGFDTITINADYTAKYTFDAAIWRNVEALKLGAGHNYSLATVDGNVAAGETLTIDGAALAATDALSFDGSAETNGTFILIGGAGNDLLRGGAGSDTASYARATSGVAVDLSIATAQSVGGGEGLDTLASVENLVGSGYNDTLAGDAGANSFEGGAGDDVLNGGAGSDTASYVSAISGVTVDLALAVAQTVGGGQGADTFVSIENVTGSTYGDVFFGNSGDNAFDGNAGTDTVSYVHATSGVTANLGSTGAQSIGGGQGNDAFVSIENLVGTAFDDTLTGSSGNNLLEGGAGNDVLNGASGSDTAYYAGATAAITVNLSTSAAQAIGGGQGTDTLISIENVVGSGYNDRLTGNADDNAFEGGAGNDTLDGGAGSDTASYAHATGGVTVNVGVTAAQSIGGGQGSDTLISIENLIGSDYNDNLTGNASTKTVIGGAGDDKITIGGVLTAASRIDGGSGYDTLSISGDYATGLALGANVQNVEDIQLASGRSYTVTTDDALVAAGAYINIDSMSDQNTDNLTVDGSRETDGIFNILCAPGNNVITGGGGNDLVHFMFASHLKATDRLDGGGGMNSLFLNGDYSSGLVFQDTTIRNFTSINFSSGFSYNLTLTDATIAAGLDIGFSASNLGANDRLVLDDSQETDGYIVVNGGAGADRVKAGAGNDTLRGGGGNDTLDGGAGNDILDGGDGLDTVSYAGATSGVTVSLAVTAAQTVGGGLGTDTLANIENLLGSAYTDVLIGDANANALSGGDEHDTLTGGAGNDTLDGGSNIDTAVFAGNMAAYTITQGATGVFTISGSDGTDTLSNIEYAKFDDTTMRLLPGSGTTIDWSADPATYMAAIRDFDGNDVGCAAGWKLIGTADVNGDGTAEHVLVNRQNGRWAEVSTEADGKNYLSNFGWAGDTRVVGIYIDPLVTLGIVVRGGDEDSQRRFQNDLNIENIHGVLGQGDYNHDGLQEIYFSLTDGTAYLHAYMHADGNIQYANYQNESQVKDYLTSNGFTSTAWAGWFPAAQAPLAAMAGG